MSKQDAKNNIDSHLKNSSMLGYSGQVTAGAIPINAASDHLPIKWKEEGDKGLEVLSWNMLSDEHLYNSFMNVANIEAYNKHFKENEALLVGNFYKDKLRTFFYELSEFARKEQGFSENNEAYAYSSKNLDEFSKSDFFFPTPKSPEEINARKESRLKMVDWFKGLPKDLKVEGPNKQDFALSVAHSLQILHHIEHGGLKWTKDVDSRLSQLKESVASKKKREVLDKGGFICLQECTSPKEVLSLIGLDDNKYQMITHNVREGSKDNCVIIYDSSIYEVLDKKKLALAHDKKKPALVVKFSNKSNPSEIIIGSIHHPGGKENDMVKVTEAITQLNQSKKCKVVIAGDFNHESVFFKESCKDLKCFKPKLGTMAANDYNNRNKAIDLVFSNIENASVERVDNFMERKVSKTADKMILVQLDGASAALGGDFSLAVNGLKRNELASGVDGLNSGRQDFIRSTSVSGVSK